MSINKIRAFYLFSLFILILLLIIPTYFIFKPTTPEDTISSNTEYNIVEIGGNTTVSLRYHYHEEDVNQNYTFVAFLNDKKLDNFRTTGLSDLRYVRVFKENETEKGNITVLIYKEGESEPIDTLTYSLGTKQ